MEYDSMVLKTHFIVSGLKNAFSISARNPEFGIWDFALASSYDGEIWDLQAKLGLFWDFNRWLGQKYLR